MIIFYQEWLTDKEAMNAEKVEDMKVNIRLAIFYWESKIIVWQHYKISKQAWEESDDGIGLLPTAKYPQRGKIN